ncbi:MAG: DedA family protein [Anaerolineales bacterium]|jgi:membrane protein DedA with SNARE-associated domain
MSSIVESLWQFWRSLQQGQVAPLGIWSYLLLMVLIVIEGPIATLLGGAAAAAGMLNPLGVLGFAMFGNLSADAFWYTFGVSTQRVWSLPFLRRYHRLIESLKVDMQRHAVKIIFLAKLSFGMTVPALIAAGAAHVPWRRWFPVVILGETLITGSLLLIGYFATQSLLHTEAAVVRFGILISLILFGGFAGYLVHKVRQGEGL